MYNLSFIAIKKIPKMWDIRVVIIFLNCTGTNFGVFDRDSIDKLMKKKKKGKKYLFFIKKKIFFFSFLKLH
jgi:hypothetical protein